MIEVAGGWALEVERGPDWLFVKLIHQTQEDADDTADTLSLADTIWLLLEQHFTYRLVLECERVAEMNSDLVDQLVLLAEKIGSRGGLLRLCGLSAANHRLLEASGLDQHFPHYADREEAVMANRPRQPR